MAGHKLKLTQVLGTISVQYSQLKSAQVRQSPKSFARHGRFLQRDLHQESGQSMVQLGCAGQQKVFNSGVSREPLLRVLLSAGGPSTRTANLPQGILTAAGLPPALLTSASRHSFVVTFIGLLLLWQIGTVSKRGQPK